MKTILRITMILLIGAIVAGAFSRVVNNGSITSGSTNGEQPPTLTSNGQFTNQQIARFEGGDRDGGSITRGLGGVFGTLAKLAGITIIVLLLQKGFDQFGKRKLVSIQR